MTSRTDRFIEAVNEALETQVVPALFSKAQQAEMARPFAEKWDYYNFSNLMTSDKEFAAHYSVAPQLAVTDPRVTAAQIAAVPKTITVTFEGEVHTIPVRVYKSASDRDPAAWKEKTEFQRRSREAAEHLETGISAKFGLAAGKDYSIGYGIGGTKTVKAAHFSVQLFNAKARKVEVEMKKYMETELAAFTPERPSEVTMMGPIRAL